MNDIQRTPEDHDLICRLVDHHEEILAKLEMAVSIAKNMLDAPTYDEFDDGCDCASKTFYDTVKDLHNFAETFKDY